MLHESSQGRVFTRLMVVGCLTLHLLLLANSLRQNYVTVDEFGHVPAGLAHWQTGNFSCYRVNPPLTRMLAVLAVLPVQPASDYTRLRDSVGARPEWDVGRDFMNANASRYFMLVKLARNVGIAWSLLGAWLVFHWSRELYGPTAGLVALVMWCFGASILAFAPLVVPDVPATVAGLGTTYVFWKFLRKSSLPLAGLVGVLLGVAELTKFTLLLFYAVWPLLWCLHRWDQRKRGLPVPALRRDVVYGGLILVLSLYVINLGYAFDGPFRPLKEFEFISPTFTGNSTPGAVGNRFHDTLLGELPVPVPAEFLRGIDAQFRDIEGGYPSYLRGELRHSGWWYYYLYALAVKEPLGFWGVAAWGLALTLFRRPGLRQDGRACCVNEWTLWLPALAILAAVSSQTGYNHHLRYVLPIFPFIIISSSKVGLLIESGNKYARVAILVLLAWGCISTLRVHPNHLAHFNEIAGGSDTGDSHLINSNIDWGQDLLRLKDWLDQHPETKLQGFACYHFVDPRLVGIDANVPPLGPVGRVPSDPQEQAKLGPHPGNYAISVNLLHGLDFVIPDGHGGDQFAPLNAFSYFQRFQPFAKAGASIFLYRISFEEANRVRHELKLPALAQ